MMPFARRLFALFVMALIAAALGLATLGWVESHPARDLSAVDSIAESSDLEAVELAER